MGSFLYLAAMRTVAGESLLRPGSHCDHCYTPLGAAELVPILSYVALQGRCKTCHAAIGIASTLTELLSGFLFVLFYLRLGLNASFVLYCTIVSILLLMAGIDLATQDVYDRHLILVGVLVFLLLVWEKKAVISALPGVFVWILFAFAAKDRMGDGDKILIGLLLFLFAPPLQLRFFLYSVWAAAGVAIFLLIHGADKKRPIPFVPFIAIGFTLVILFHGGV